MMRQLGAAAAYAMVPAGVATAVPVFMASVLDDAARLRELGVAGILAVVVVTLSGVVVVGYRYAAKQSELRIADLKASAEAQRLANKETTEALIKVLSENSRVIAAAEATINSHTLAVQAMTRHCTEKNGATHIP